MRVTRKRERAVTAVFCIRGQGQDVAVLPCEDWGHAIRKGQRVLPRFDQRNPWLFFDSRQQKLYILLDPDTDQSMAQPSRSTQPKPRTSTKKGIHL